MILDNIIFMSKAQIYDEVKLNSQYAWNNHSNSSSKMKYSQWYYSIRLLKDFYAIVSTLQQNSLIQSLQKDTSSSSLWAENFQPFIEWK